MNFSKVKWLIPGALVVFGISMDFSMAENAGSPVSITSQVNELVQQVDANGQSHWVAVNPDRIVPGDRILYTTNVANNGGQASDNIVITNPVPQHVRYLGNTAQGSNFTIVYSVDGGQQFGQPGQLQVRDASGQVRQAQPAEYTHIRWQYNTALQPAETQKISFQAQLK
uniref:DUF11 domain-containing protein n=1 Tax=uncultured Thiotrichaceae bacterium TaxID=298394 RepID=A0A6S6TER2_9GAMM|nr:MAG: Unknown protein [uncultured Thiotrichaceae bacterium]